MVLPRNLDFIKQSNEKILLSLGSGDLLDRGTSVEGTGTAGVLKGYAINVSEMLAENIRKREITSGSLFSPGLMYFFCFVGIGWAGVAPRPNRWGLGLCKMGSEILYKIS